MMFKSSGTRDVTLVVKAKFSILPRKVWTVVTVNRYNHTDDVHERPSGSAHQVWICFSRYLYVYTRGNWSIGKRCLVLRDPGRSSVAPERRVASASYGYPEQLSKAVDKKTPFIIIGRGVPIIEE